MDLAQAADVLVLSFCVSVLTFAEHRLTVEAPYGLRWGLEMEYDLVQNKYRYEVAESEGYLSHFD